MLFIKRHLIWILLFVFSVLYSFISVIKHLHFQTGLDLAIYVQTFWNYAHLQWPFVTLYPTFGDLVWADHFTPSLILLAPLYFFWQNPVHLLILQSVLFVAGGLPVYKFAKEKLQSEILSLTIVLSYLLFFGTQFALTFDFHSATYSAVFLPWIFWFMLTGRWKLFGLFCLFAILGKEDMPLLLSTLGVYMVITGRNRKLGFILFLSSFIYFLTVTRYLMPLWSVLSAKIYTTPFLSADPRLWIDIMLGSPVKLRTMFLSLAAFSFLPVLSGWYLVLILAHFFVNFASHDFPGRWDIYLHYRVQLASIMSFAVILGIEKLLIVMKKLKNNLTIKQLSNYINIILSICLLSVIFVFDYTLHLPFNTLFKPGFYRSEGWMEDNFAVMEKIPRDAFLLTQNNLAPHVANRRYLFYYPMQIDKAEYIFLDLRPGQLAINNWLSPPFEVMKKEAETFVHDGKFEMYYRKGDAVLLKRIGK